MSDEWKRIADRLDDLVERLDRILPPSAREPDWKAGSAFRWRRHAKGGYLEAVRHPHTIRFSDLKGSDISRRCSQESNNPPSRFLCERLANSNSRKSHTRYC